MGYMYLHTNGDLIYKPHAEATDLRESDFVRAFWRIDPRERLTAWDCVVGATLLVGPDNKRVQELIATWGLTDKDAAHHEAACGVTVSMDGNMWCATGPGFTNLQESPAGFGESHLLAIVDLCRKGDYAPRKLWGEPASTWLRKCTGTSPL